jgi:hypothetical protein
MQHWFPESSAFNYTRIDDVGVGRLVAPRFHNYYNVNVLRWAIGNPSKGLCLSVTDNLTLNLERNMHICLKVK